MKRLTKRALVVFTIVLIAGTFAGCEALLALFQGEPPEPPATAQEQVNGFLTAASAETRDNELLQSYFDPAADDHDNMLLDSYWEARFFNPDDGPYAILNSADGEEDPDFQGSVTVTGNVTNFVNTDPGYPAVFTLTQADETSDPLIRRIEVTVLDTTEVITKVID